MSFHDRFADNTNPDSVASRLRRRRFKLFRALVEPLQAPIRVLDVGGTAGFWRMVPAEWKSDLRITLLNLTLPDDVPEGYESVAGDARDLSGFEDASFDVVFSNSVIEHVGTAEDQASMAREIRRVGRHHYVQTPNRRFPIEPHFQFPLFQYLPVAWRVALVRRYELGWYDRLPDPADATELVRSIRLLSKREFAGLFPDSTIVTERFLGLPKSFIAISPGTGS